jgi:hypothetical protein
MEVEFLSGRPEAPADSRYRIIIGPLKSENG